MPALGKRALEAALSGWAALNDCLREAEEQHCEALLRAERAGAGRRQFLLRIHSRLNKVRADRERRELLAGR